jgi:cytochrome c oxidase subunit 2
VNCTAIGTAVPGAPVFPRKYAAQADDCRRSRIMVCLAAVSLHPPATGHRPIGAALPGRAAAKLKTWESVGDMRLAIGFLALLGITAGACLTMLFDGSAYAAAGIAEDWQLGFQDAVTPVMREINSFHNFILYIITAISVFVLGLLVLVMVKFNAKANPTPSKTTHNSLVEVLWTVIPILILLVIAVPSFRLLYLQRDIPQADMTIKATASQWLWSYEYPDHDDLTFDAQMVEDGELQPGQPRLLTADNVVVVPVNKTVRVIVTANTVLHNWAMPSFGIKMDAVPGRLNETWFRAEKTGMYYGQCSELCGIRHAFMPINVKVVSEDEFKEWLVKAKEEFADAEPAADTRVAGKTAE